MNEETNRVSATLNSITPDLYQDVIVIGITPVGLLDIKPSIPQYPFTHWVLNKALNELWVMERGEIEDRVRKAEAEQIVDTTEGPFVNVEIGAENE